MRHEIARNSLDFWSAQSVYGERNTGIIMDAATIKPAIGILMSEMHSRLREAAQIAQAAEACVSAGSVTEGIAVSMDIEQLIYEAGRLQDAASLLNRLSRD